jgi:SSS family solute:Na+ symporter
MPTLSSLAAAWFPHWEIGLVALIANAAVTVGLSLASPRKELVAQPA